MPLALNARSLVGGTAILVFMEEIRGPSREVLICRSRVFGRRVGSCFFLQILRMLNCPTSCVYGHLPEIITVF